MLNSLFGPVAFALLLPVGVAGGVEPDRGIAQYLIECRIFVADASGREVVIAEPHLVVSENRPASLRQINRTPRPGKTMDAKWLEEGTAIDVTIFLDDDGQRFLDANVQLTRRPTGWPPQKAGIRLRTTAVRVVEPVKLGEKIVVPLDGDGKQRVELRVSDLAHDDPKCDPAAELSPGLILGGVTPRIIVQEEEEERLGIECP